MIYLRSCVHFHTVDVANTFLITDVHRKRFRQSDAHLKLMKYASLSLPASHNPCRAVYISLQLFGFVFLVSSVIACQALFAKHPTVHLLSIISHQSIHAVPRLPGKHRPVLTWSYLWKNGVAVVANDPLKNGFQINESNFTFTMAF